MSGIADNAGINWESALLFLYLINGVPTLLGAGVLHHRQNATSAEPMIGHWGFPLSVVPGGEELFFCDQISERGPRRR